MAGLLAHLRTHRRDRLHVNFGVRQCLVQHVQHQPVVGQKAGIVRIAAQYIGPQQQIHRPWVLGGQGFQRHLGRAIGTLAGGAVDDHVRAYTLVGAEHGILHSLLVQLHPLRQAITHKAHIVEPAFFHSRALRHSRHAEIQCRGRAACKRLHRERPRHCIGNRVPCVVLCHFLQDGVLPHAGGARFAVQAFPQHPDGSHHQEQQQKPCRHEPPAPAPAQHPPPVFLIVCHGVFPHFSAPVRPGFFCF